MQSLYLTRQLSDVDKPAPAPAKADTLETWIVRAHCDKGSLQVQRCKTLRQFGLRPIVTRALYSQLQNPRKYFVYAHCDKGCLQVQRCKTPLRSSLSMPGDKGIANSTTEQKNENISSALGSFLLLWRDWGHVYAVVM